MKTYPNVEFLIGNVFFTVVFSLFPHGQGDQAVFFDEAFYEGSTFTLSAKGDCYNFKQKWINRISSVQIQPDSCMIAWTGENCDEQSIKLVPNGRDTMDLRTVGFDKKIKSISLCMEISFRPGADEVGDRMLTPSPERNFNEERNEGIGQRPELYHGIKRQSVELNFYDETNFRGSIFTLTSNGDCYNFKPKWMQRISSLDSGGHCIIIWDKPCCEGVSATVSSDDIKAFQNLDRISFNKRIQSVQLCKRPLVIDDIESDEDVSGREIGPDVRRGDNTQSQSNGPSSQAPPIDSTAEKEIREISLLEHNKIRRLHGVPDLKWDFKLQDIAQIHANWLAQHNKFEHSNNEDFGENIGGISTSNKIYAIKQSISLWYNEIKHYDFDKPSVSVLGIKAGHFTQLVWKTTTHIGLGIAWNPRRHWYVIVCNYSPPGNYKGDYEKNVLPPAQKKELV